MADSLLFLQVNFFFHFLEDFVSISVKGKFRDYIAEM